jgi:S-DNA-T family DNA segregation ATPase FtsK/SpoIIIE
MIDRTCQDLSDKLKALNLYFYSITPRENDFNITYYIDFRENITFSKVKAREKDLSIFFDSEIELSSFNGLIVLKVAKSGRTPENTFAYFGELPQDYILPLAIGRTEDGSKLFYDLVKCPHLLVGGATGSGKSVFLNNCIMSLIYGKKSALCMIDVKKVELSLYEDITPLAAPIAYDVKAAKNLLSNLCFTMDNRYKTLKENKCRTIEEYINKGYKMQYITIIIDEIADLFMQDKRIEPLVIRIAQLGRACGMHLIIATQRPDSHIISGLIRANVPSRVCFAVQKATDSRIIIDTSGGEKLAGKGDGLFKPIGSRDCIRFQAPYITTEDIINTTEKIKTF